MDAGQFALGHFKPPVRGRRYLSAISDPDDVAAISIPPSASEVFMLKEIHFGYSDTPVGGLLTIEFGENTITVPVTQGGAGVISFDHLSPEEANVGIDITLSAGGGTTVGYLNVLYY